MNNQKQHSGLKSKISMLFTIFQSDSQFMHGHIYNMQSFKTIWVNSLAYQNHRGC